MAGDGDQDARVPFAAVGVLLVIVSTIATAYLMSMETREVARGIGEDADRDLSRALALAAADIGSALNYAGLGAESAVGAAPVINVSEGSPFATIEGNADDGRIRYLAWRQLSQYLATNYNGSFTYGDYVVTAALTGDYRSLSVSPGNMTLYRKFDHPLAPCRKDYTAYYTLSVPLQLIVRKAGSDLTYSEDRTVSSLITARYPLLRALTSEYEGRLNGTPLTLDLAAAAFACTWARGYTQYATGSPLNIVDNVQVEQIVNGATLLEQGFAFNSVDPMGLAALAGELVNGQPAKINGYDVGNNSKDGLPRDRSMPPERYAFTIDDMVDRAYDNVSFGGYAEKTLDGAYTVRMHLDIRREFDGYPRVNATFVREERREPGPPATPGEWPILVRTFEVYHDNSDGEGFADRVSVTYVVSEYSALRYTGGDAGDPALSGSSDDVAGPFEPFPYEKDLSFGRKAFVDDNLCAAVECYEASFDWRYGKDYFERTLAEIIADREGGEARVPAAFADRSYAFVCGPSNDHPAWAEIEADYELQDLCRTLKAEVAVDLSPAGFGGSPGAMARAGYERLVNIFEGNYDRYLDSGSYFCPAPPGGYCRSPAYVSCGAKAIFRIRHAFLEDVRRQLRQAADRSGDAINRTIDRQMDGTGMNSTDLAAGAATAKSYLAGQFYIPFGLPMGLNSSDEFARGYPWEEDVTLAIDQSPPYLSGERYVDPETGYAVRPLRLRNVCLFSPSADLIPDGEGTDAALETTLGMVPSGLPLLPPYGWWATLNVWYIEVQGEIPAFTVYDADVEAVPDPVFGSRAISCTRRHQVVRDDEGRVLGYNEPLRFRAKTATFILVPPGAQGIGDKAGGWDEKSPGYDEKEAPS